MNLSCFVPLDRHTSSSPLRHTLSREVEVILSQAKLQSYLISINIESGSNSWSCNEEVSSLSHGIDLLVASRSIEPWTLNEDPDVLSAH